MDKTEHISYSNLTSLCASLHATPYASALTLLNNYHKYEYDINTTEINDNAITSANNANIADSIALPTKALAGPCTCARSSLAAAQGPGTRVNQHVCNNRTYD